jgi:hypothetical protein
MVAVRKTLKREGLHAAANSFMILAPFRPTSQGFSEQSCRTCTLRPFPLTFGPLRISLHRQVGNDAIALRGGHVLDPFCQFW